MTIDYKKVLIQRSGRFRAYHYKRQIVAFFLLLYVSSFLQKPKQRFFFLPNSSKTSQIILSAHSQKFLTFVRMFWCHSEHFWGFSVVMRRTFLSPFTNFQVFPPTFLQKGKPSGHLSDFEFFFSFLLICLRIYMPLLLCLLETIVYGLTL